jgi:hypothetical protein
MRKLAFLLGASAAAAVAAILVGLVVQRASALRSQEEVPEILDDCFDRIQRIEKELHRLKPTADTVA